MTVFTLYLRRVSHPSLVEVLSKQTKRYLLVMRHWHQNYRSRRHLKNLPPHLLDDIGIDEVSASKQAQKPFWKD
jgi:uncharacterized protein YjiS (DUF1127 family)